jgi:hypothetical protein
MAVGAYDFDPHPRPQSSQLQINFKPKIKINSNLKELNGYHKAWNEWKDHITRHGMNGRITSQNME